MNHEYSPKRRERLVVVPDPPRGMRLHGAQSPTWNLRPRQRAKFRTTPSTLPQVCAYSTGTNELDVPRGLSGRLLVRHPPARGLAGREQSDTHGAMVPMLRALAAALVAAPGWTPGLAQRQVDVAGDSLVGCRRAACAGEGGTRLAMPYIRAPPSNRLPDAGPGPTHPAFPEPDGAER
jgi:hypothetical protein